MTCIEDALGGGFMLPLYAELIDFVHHLQSDIGHGKTGFQIGVAILDYGMNMCSSMQSLLVNRHEPQ